MNAVGVFVIPKRRLVFSKGIFLKQRKSVVGRFVSPKRGFTEVASLAMWPMVYFHD
jgi:hypothetical protein